MFRKEPSSTHSRQSSQTARSVSRCSTRRREYGTMSRRRSQRDQVASHWHFSAGLLNEIDLKVDLNG